MRCCFRCSYCFLTKGEKQAEETLFDIHTSAEWVKAMANFSQHEVEFYCWGGEPFLLDGTYELVRGWTDYRHVIGASRLDTNMAFAEKIAQRCPSRKVKLNCSWHPEYFTFKQIFERVKRLSELGMVGMVNFVASPQNLHALETQNGLTVDDLIARFEDLGVYANIAADFAMVNGKDPDAVETYKKFILQYLCPEDWRQLRCEKGPSICDANRHFFTLHPNGDITPCLGNRVCGNFFTGQLELLEPEVCHKPCPSLVAYPFRRDNQFPFKSHLVEYVARNRAYRLSRSAKRPHLPMGIPAVGRALATAAPVRPEVSVVLPTFNQARYLPRAVQSLLAQTFQNFELIIVNDGSTDGTREYLDALADPRIRVVHQDNQRLPGALNAGFRQARGRYLTWVSSDNWCAPIFLEALVRGLEAQPGAGFAFSAFAWIDEQDQITGFQRDQDLGLASLLRVNPGVAAFMYRRECLEAVGEYDVSLEGAEDWDMWIRIRERFDTVYIPEILYYYRVHADSMTGQIRPQIQRASAAAFQKALARHQNQLDLQRLYPAITQCQNREVAEFHACMDMGAGLLQSPYGSVEVAARFLEAALDKAKDWAVFVNLAVAYGRLSQWALVEQCLAALARCPHQKARQIADLARSALNQHNPSLFTGLPLMTLDRNKSELLQKQRELARIFSLTEFQAQAGAAAAPAPASPPPPSTICSGAGHETAGAQHPVEMPLPAAVQPCLRRAEQAIQQGDLAAACACLREAVEQAPQHPELLTTLGSLEFQRGDFHSALAAFSRAVALQPANITVLLQGALAALKLDQIEDFERMIAQALSLDAHHPETLKLLANLNMEQGRYADAGKMYHQLLQQAPGDVDTLLAVGRCFFETRNYAEAQMVYERILEVAPASAIARENLAVVVQRRSQSGHPPEKTPLKKNSNASIKDSGVAGHPPTAGLAIPPEISVILPTYNRPHILAQCLEGFAQQTLAADRFEVVILDDGSQPRAQPVAERFASRLKITYQYQPNAGLAAARNACIQRAQAPLLALHDDDDIPASDYLEQCLAFHRAHPEEADILLAQVKPHPSLEQTPLLEWMFDRQNGVIGFPDPALIHPYQMFFGGTSSCKRSLFSRGLYNPEYRFGFEDMELAHRLNQQLTLRVHYRPQVASYLVRGPDFAGLFRRAYREGRSFHRFFRQAGEAALRLMPVDMRRAAKFVAEIAPALPDLLKLIHQAGPGGINGPLNLTINGKKLAGVEALKTCYTLCGLYGRARGWLDFAEGVQEGDGLECLDRLLGESPRATVSPASESTSPAKGPTLLSSPSAGKRALVYFRSNPFPPRSGAHRRCLSTLAGLRALGYEITLVSDNLFNDQSWNESSVAALKRDHGITACLYHGTTADRAFIAEAQSRNNFWAMHIPPGLAGYFRKLFQELAPELVLVNYAYSAPLIAGSEFAQALRLIEMHDLVSLSTAMASVAWKKLGVPPYPGPAIAGAFLDEQFYRQLGLEPDPLEFHHYRKFDGVIAIAPNEAELVRHHAPRTAVGCLPLALSVEKVDNTYQEGPVLVMFHNPFNFQGYGYFVEKVLPRVRQSVPDFNLRVVGDACPSLKPAANVSLLGFVPELKSVYAASQFAICPLIGGTGQQVKIVEAMAHGLPVVVLRNVASSSPVEHARNGFIADDAGEFAEYVIRLSQDAGLCRTMGEAARQTILEKHSPKSFARRLEQIITQAQTTRKPARLAGKSDSPAAPASEPASADLTRAPSPSLPVRWLAPFFNPSGYASEAINFVIPLLRATNLGIFHHTTVTSPAFMESLPTVESGALLQSAKKFNSLAGGIVISHNPAHAFTRLDDAVYHVGRTMFETDRIPALWARKCNDMDEVWVPSPFNVETFAASGVKRDKLVVMPGAVDANFYDPARHQPLALPHRRRFNFLAVFEWTYRKGWDVLLAAYLREFSAEDDVCLYLRAYLLACPDQDPTAVLQKLIAEYTRTLNLGTKLLPPIEILAEQVPTRELPRLYLAADCLVAPSRGEGWGRPHHESMMMGVPVIATNWSGNTAFMTADNSYLLDYELAEVDPHKEELPLYRGHRWANPSETHLRQLMRQVRQHPEEAREKGQKARACMVKHFSREAVAEKVLQRLAEIERKISTPACPAEVARAEHAGAKYAVAWEGSQFVYHSLALVNRELCLQLMAQGHELNIIPCEPDQFKPEVDARFTALAKQVNVALSRPAQIHVRHQWPPNFEPPQRGHWVLMQPWEFGSLPKAWVPFMQKQIDEIWVYTRFLKNCYVECGIPAERIHIVPLGIDPAAFHPGVQPFELPRVSAAANADSAAPKPFTFLFVGGAIGRKGADVLLKAYLRAFRRSDPVRLVVKNMGSQTFYRGQTLAQEIQRLQHEPAAPEIVYLDEDLPGDKLPGLYTACDCLVHPYRGEGFGLPVLEAMACGLPVIVTAGGATDDFATDEYAYRIPSRRKDIGSSVGDMELVKDGWLLEPDETALVEKMRWIVSHREEAVLKGRAASGQARREWTWHKAAQVVHARLRTIAQQGKPLRERKGAPSLLAAPTVELPPTGHIGRLKTAYEHLRQGRCLEAWNAGLAALKSRPFHPEACVMMGECALAAGDASLAKKCAERALKMAPQYELARGLMSQLARKNKNGRKLKWPALPADASAKPRLSVCLIAKNEEQFIAGCLASVKGAAHQIVLLDTGSTDKTAAIAQAHGAEVYHFQWNDNFSDARNAALEHATGDWVLMLDADEELPAKEHPRLLHDMANTFAIGLRLPMVHRGLEDQGTDHVPRLFRNAPGLFYVGRVHEQLFPSALLRGKEWGLEVAVGSATLVHNGYNPRVIQSRGKIQRNLALLRQAVVEMPGEPHLLMNLGLELVRSGEVEDGLARYQEAFESMSCQPEGIISAEIRESLLTQMGSHLLRKNRFQDVVQLLCSPLANQQELTASMHYLLGLSLMQLKQHAEAARAFNRCIQKRSQPALTLILKEIHSVAPRHCLANCLAATGEFPEAEQAFREAMKEDPAARVVKIDFARFWFDRQQPVEALKLLHQMAGEKADEPQVWELGGRIALSQPDFMEFAADWTAEAVRNCPMKPNLAALRAEFLLLNQTPDQSAELWEQDGAAVHPRSQAAWLICQVVLDRGAGLKPAMQSTPEPALSKEFITWYQRLLQFGANQMVEALNQRLEVLKQVLPSAAKVLEGALAEAQSQ